MVMWPVHLMFVKRFLDLQSELKLSLYFHVLCDDIYLPSLIVEKLPCMQTLKEYLGNLS